MTEAHCVLWEVRVATEESLKLRRVETDDRVQHRAWSNVNGDQESTCNTYRLLTYALTVSRWWQTVNLLLIYGEILVCILQNSLLPKNIHDFKGPEYAVGTPTRYGLEGLGTRSRWGARFFAPGPERPWDSPNLLYNGYRVIAGGEAAGAWC